ncbi:uncharacterized protein [Montipora foliosa]|uniref:uncharacterized protein n=1 Tax=Montipora foliosa TaxID=591990 RepID=UPI0035F21937
MSFIEYRNLLSTIGRSLEELDRTYLLYLFESKIQAGNEHNIRNVLTLFKEMEANNTLGIDRLENLKELLRVLEKWHLFKEVRKFEIKRRKYNDLLQQISEALDESIELERLISICRGKILAEREAYINDTRSLFRELETQNNLEFSRLDFLKEVLNSMQKEYLLRKVEDFERWRNDEDESACRGGERAVMFAHARSLGGMVFGVLTMKTICKVGAAGITLLTVNELLKRSDTCEQLMASFTDCVLPAGTQLMDISRGCVCFTIKADNLAALCTLWNMYQDGTLRLLVKNFVLTEEMIKLAGGEENVEVTVAIGEDEYEKACFEFIREQEGAKLRKPIRRNSDSALAALPYEDEVSLVKMKQLENAFKLQQERIASLEKEVEMLPKLFLQTESPQTTTEKGKGDVDKAEETKRDPLVERMDKAERYIGLALDIQKEKLGSQYPDFADDYIELAVVCREKGDLDEAERYLGLALDIRKEKLESQQLDVADDYIELAAVCREKGDLNEAERYLGLALDIRKENLGSQHPDVADDYIELAAVRRQKGDLDEAELYLTLALDIRKEWLGSKHPDVAAVYYDLATVCREKGDLDGAEWYRRLGLI